MSCVEFTFTVNGFQTLFELIRRLQKQENLEKVPQNLPILMVSGAEDPVGDYGKGVRKACDSLKKAGVKILPSNCTRMTDMSF